MLTATQFSFLLQMKVLNRLPGGFIFSVLENSLHLIESRRMLQGFPAVQVSHCMGVFYNTIYKKCLDEERTS